MPDRPVSPFCPNCLSLNPDQHIALRNEGVPESSMREIERREVKGYRNYEDTLIYIAIQMEVDTLRKSTKKGCPICDLLFRIWTFFTESKFFLSSLNISFFDTTITKPARSSYLYLPQSPVTPEMFILLYHIQLYTKFGKTDRSINGTLEVN